MANTIGVVILAAGQSRRYGKDDKRRAMLANGEELLQQTVASALAADLPVMVVLRPGDDALQAALQQKGAHTVIAEDAALGMGHSLVAGISAVDHWDGALIALGDMPCTRPESYRRVAQALSEHKIVRPFYRGEPGQPVGFSCCYFPEMKTLSGDVGAKHILKREQANIYQLDVDDAGIRVDIDTPEQLQRAAAQS